MPWASAEHALPRDPITAIHGAVGAWEFGTVPANAVVPEGWDVHCVYIDHITLRKTQWEQCGCGLEYEHDPDLMWLF